MTATAYSTSPLPSSSPEFRVTNNPVLRGETRMARPQGETLWQSHPLIGGTDALARPDSPAVSVRRTLPATDAPTARHDRRNYVDGVISEAMDNGLVKCIVYVGGRELLITLPSDCFEMNVAFGRPFRLTMEQKAGFRVPKATPRASEPLSDDDEALIHSVIGDAVQ